MEKTAKKFFLNGLNSTGRPLNGSKNVIFDINCQKKDWNFRKMSKKSTSRIEVSKLVFLKVRIKSEITQVSENVSEP